MKDNVIWVDFNSKNKRKSPFKKTFSKILTKLKNIFYKSRKRYNFKLNKNHYDKSIL
ncbi:hypothetical protein M2651_00350 [Clostridium sp. SYSU_GA19001]|uniref:hypothetical protein n=1 Tax=Clostridium caldaquaticum TaxID=2940653 RepID=UPI0020778F23|nr:hypothetical protein [Clostridium caldaquaticum]MCM8709473.1 hypothetical protein [Clostridium caldaquaticum]